MKQRSFPRWQCLAVLVMLAWPSTAFALDIIPVTSPGGIRAWLVEDHRRPIITVMVRFPTGSVADPAGREGLVHLATGLFDEGAGDLASDAFRASLEEQSIALGFAARRESLTMSLMTLTETSDLAFKLAHLALSRPRFDPGPLERVRNQVIAGIRARRERPGTITWRTWWTSAFPGHPYSRPLRGTIDSLRRITRDDLLALAPDLLARDGVLVAAVGDITPDRLGSVLDDMLGDLAGSPVRVPVPEVAHARPGAVTVVDRDLAQSVIVFGHDGIGRDDPDWYAAVILFEVLAGGHGSRLRKELRETRGLTYSVSAGPVLFDHAALVTGRVSTGNSRAAETIAHIRAVWRDFAANGPTEQEVHDAKEYIKGSRALRLASSPGIARTLLGIQVAELGIDYLDRQPAMVDAVSMHDLRRVAARLFRERELAFVVVGRPSGVEATHHAPEGPPPG
ncbi:MAG: pitrilysin family protein [Alphaproteobacteria bacterium]|nr:pitrilysin family protein [Alphaproteobacteria bacterium]